MRITSASASRSSDRSTPPLRSESLSDSRPRILVSPVFLADDHLLFLDRRILCGRNLQNNRSITAVPLPGLSPAQYRIPACRNPEDGARLRVLRPRSTGLPLRET